MTLIRRLLPSIVAFLIFAVVAAGIAVIVSDAILTERSLREMQMNRAAVLRSQLDQETGIRGYAATRDPRFLDPYRRGLTAFKSSVATLRAEFSQLESPEEIVLLDDEEHIHQQWLALIARPLIANPRATSSLSVEIEGKRFIDRFRADDDHLAEQLKALSALLAQEEQRAISVFVGGGGGVALLVGGLLYWNGSRHRRAIEEARRQALLFERERHVASMLERAVIERRLPSIPGLEIDSFHQSAANLDRVGGDWFDVFELRDGWLFIIPGGHPKCTTSGQLKMYQGSVAT